MGPIDVNVLNSIKFHPLPYTHITPSDVDAESYKRGWNDVIDSIIESAPTIEPERKKGKWIDGHRMRWDGTFYWFRQCDQCGYERNDCDTEKDTNFCPNCGADMREEQDETD